jgi:hypothetical protein
MPVEERTPMRKEMMREMMRAKLIPTVVLVCACLLLVACEETTIGKINEDPGRYANREVTLRGTVNNSFGLLGQGAYELDDGTGKMWILVEKGGVPSKGARVRTVGRVVGSATFGGRNFGTALRESKHRVDR